MRAGLRMGRVGGGGGGGGGYGGGVHNPPTPRALTGVCRLVQALMQELDDC